MEGIIERGIITAAADGRYTVASYDRGGITTPPLAALGGEGYSAGDKVIYFIFPDGTGRVICGM